MQLPHVRKTGNTPQGRERLRGAAFALAVVHDRHTRIDRKRSGVCDVGSAVMWNQVQVHRAEQIHRTEQLVERRTAEISEIDEPELAERYPDAGRSRIFDRLCRVGRLRRTGRVRRSRACDRFRHDGAVAAHDLDVDALERNAVARLRHDMPAAGPNRDIRVEWPLRRVVARRDRVVIDERMNRQAGGELGNAAGVVAMKMRDQQIVDVRNAGSFGRSGNPVRVPSAVCREAGVDEQRLPGRGLDQGGLTAFDVDEIDVQSVGSGERPRQRHRNREHTGPPETHRSSFAGLQVWPLISERRGCRACPRIARLHTTAEGIDALSGGTVREPFRHDAAGGHPLQTVVADGRGGAQRLLCIPRLELNVPGLQ